MLAQLVYDGSGDPKLHATSGTPAEGQFMGTPAEKLVEICGRECYDSFGRGRSSVEYHAHINEVNHGSVQEHFQVTVQFIPERWGGFKLIARAVANRPGVWLEDATWPRITANLRAIREWHDNGLRKGCWVVGQAMKSVAHGLAPNIVSEPEINPDWYGSFMVAEPETDEEKWVSMFMSGSRGFSHEQVRHKWRTAVSQRSTRYVDEHESDWTVHPVVKDFFSEQGNDVINDATLMCDRLATAREKCQEAYKDVVDRLQAYLIDKGADKLTARKQARGAARGWLGNALETSMIFSASVAQWKRMIKQRANPAADGEIRTIYQDYVIPELKKSRYSDCFRNIGV